MGKLASTFMVIFFWSRLRLNLMPFPFLEFPVAAVSEQSLETNEKRLEVGQKAIGVGSEQRDWKVQRR